MYMFKYILKRLGLMLLTFSIIMTMCFVLVKSIPNAPQQGALGESYERMLMEYNARGYNLPILQQYGRYLKNVFVNGDFGIGTTYTEFRFKPVLGVFLEQLPATVLINVYATLFSVPLGLLLGIYAALRKNKWQDYTISTLTMVVISVPSYVFAFLIQYILCFKLQLFPITMKDGFDYFSPEMFRSMVPASFALSFGSIAGYTRFTRAELTEVLTSDYMLLARTKGLTRAQATTRHALRNAMVPIFPSIVSEFISVLGGSLIIESIFSVPGVGKLFLGSLQAKDYDFYMLLTAFYTLIGLVAGIVVDLSYGIIDPRIRMGAR